MFCFSKGKVSNRRVRLIFLCSYTGEREGMMSDSLISFRGLKPGLGSATITVSPTRRSRFQRKKLELSNRLHRKLLCFDSKRASETLPKYDSFVEIPLISVGLSYFALFALVDSVCFRHLHNPVQSLGGHSEDLQSNRKTTSPQLKAISNRKE